MNESLEEDRDHLLRSLEDLDRERAAGDLDEADYLVLKEDYTARAAEVLRALAPSPPAPDPGGNGDGVGGSDGDAKPRRRVTVAAAPPSRSRLRPALVAVTLLAFAAGTGALAARSVGERGMGDPASGSIEATGPSGGIADDLAKARDLIGAGKTLDAIKVYDSVIKRDPRQPEALAYRGWLLRLAGRAAGNTELIDKGLEFIERALAADPTYPDAHFFRAFVLYQDRKDPAAAVPEFRAFLAANPPKEMVALVEDLLRKALAESGAPTTPPAQATTTPPSPGAESATTAPAPVATGPGAEKSKTTIATAPPE